MTFGTPDLRIGAVADFARHHEGEDARDVGFVRQRQQVEHQLDMLFVDERNAGRRFRNDEIGVAADLRFRALEAALDLADAFEVRSSVDRSCAPSVAVSPWPESRGVENAAVFLSAREPGLDAAALAEHALEHLARIDFHRHRVMSVRHDSVFM